LFPDVPRDGWRVRSQVLCAQFSDFRRLATFVDIQFSYPKRENHTHTDSSYTLQHRWPMLSSNTQLQPGNDTGITRPYFAASPLNGFLPKDFHMYGRDVFFGIKQSIDAGLGHKSVVFFAHPICDCVEGQPFERAILLLQLLFELFSLLTTKNLCICHLLCPPKRDLSNNLRV